jgi:hypothetical protein
MPSHQHARDHMVEYLTASALAATLNYPLWRVSAVRQSGFALSTSPHTTGLLRRIWAPYAMALQPPYKGCMATVVGMTWARAAIFGGSDWGHEVLRDTYGCSPTVATLLPPLLVSTLVQVCNMPLVRATITLQNPQSTLPNVWASVQYIVQHQGGIPALWHGTSAGILKTVPKYCTAIAVKDYMESILPRPIPPCHNNTNDTTSYRYALLLRSACKAVAAGVAGAVLTNPLDVLRNGMFTTNQGLLATMHHLHASGGAAVWWRGLLPNVIAVSVPVASTIFFTDVLIQLRNE